MTAFAAMETSDNMAEVGSQPTSNNDRGYTTVMLRNIPNKYTQQMLLEQLYQIGFRTEIDYLYVPIDFSNRCNCGYCFINFRSSAARERFVELFDGKPVQTCLPGFNSFKVCQVKRAKWQGRDENVKRLKSGPELMGMLVAHPEWLPLILDADGNQEPFSVDGVQATPSLPYRKGGRKAQPVTKRPSSEAIHFHEALLLSGAMDAVRGQGAYQPARTRRGGGGGGVRGGFQARNNYNHGNSNSNSNGSNKHISSNGNSGYGRGPLGLGLGGQNFGAVNTTFGEVKPFGGIDDYVLARALELANLEVEHRAAAAISGGSYEPFAWYGGLEENMWPTTDSPSAEADMMSTDFQKSPAKLMLDSPRRVEIGPAFA